MEKLTIEILQDIVNKCETRLDFKKCDKNAYHAAERKKLLDYLFREHKNNGLIRQEKGGWTLERLQEEANKYETRSEFQNNSKGAYLYAMKNNLLDDLFKSHTNNGYSTKRKQNGYWTLDMLQEEANKYESRIEFEKINNGAYTSAVRQNLLDILFDKHINKGFSTKKNRDGYVTFEMLQEEANKYETRNEFNHGNQIFYNYSCKHKLLDKLFAKHFNQGFSTKKNRDGYLTFEMMQEEANKYKNRIDFSKVRN